MNTAHFGIINHDLARQGFPRQPERGYHGWAIFSARRKKPKRTGYATTVSAAAAQVGFRDGAGDRFTN
jgi:hypothetical protein